METPILINKCWDCFNIVFFYSANKANPYTRMFLDNVEDRHVEVFTFLSNGLIHETTPENIEAYVDSSFDKSKLQEYCQTFTKPSEIPGFKEEIKNSIKITSTDSIRTFVLLMNALDSRILAPAVTGSLTLVRDMKYEELQTLLESWQNSILEVRRRLFRLIYSLTMATVLKLATELHNQASGYAARDVRESLYEDQKIDPFRYTMMEHPTGNELYIPNVDALIIGSGSGAGVVAHTLSKEGHKCLILEKGKYFHPTDLGFNDVEGLKEQYEQGATLVTNNQQFLILAGATFGGGSSVNWSACLKTPFKIRKEWYDEYGVDWAADEFFETCSNFVFDKMGATLEGIDHSFTNRAILNGSEKLGYTAKPVAQNNGGHPNHDCGHCHLGCKYGIKQGSANFWFRDAAENGCQFMEQVKVVRILHKHGKAVGVLCKSLHTGEEFKISGPKKYIACGGSMNTPLVLQNSGFKNKNIGANLKLHPSMCLLADFGKDIRMEPHNKSILTTVCTQADDYDGKAHGAKIEALLHSPILEAVYFPWRNSDTSRRDLLRYNHLSAFLIITRDTSSGTLRADKNKPDSIIVDYAINKFDREALAKSIIIAADIAYIEGAKEIIHPQSWVKGFVSNKPKDQRDINDKDYAKWREETSKVKLDAYGCQYGSAHQMSSCRISGKGPSQGACDTRGRLYECKNIYVADASALPTASGVNPMISTMTLARIIAVGINKDLQPQVRL